MRLAAVADVHFTSEKHEEDVRRFLPVNDLADALVIAGDLTNHGTSQEMHACLAVLKHVRIPIVAVLGNHDYESGHQDELTGLARLAGIQVLDGDCAEVMGVGLAGVKGFCGGFTPHELMPFGEESIKAFVETAERETIKLDYALAQLHSPIKVAVMHYAPIKETVIGEPEPVFPFLGSSRLERALESHRPALAVHGHAHHGSFCAETKSGVKVCNVALSILRERQEPHPFTVFHF